MTGSAGARIDDIRDAANTDLFTFCPPLGRGYFVVYCGSQVFVGGLGTGSRLRCCDGRAAIYRSREIISLGLSIWLATNPSFPKVIRYLCYCAFLALAVALMIDLVPGFNKLLVFERVQFSPDSFPFTMYLNFDKIVVGVFIRILYLKSYRQILDRRSLLLSARCAGVLISILMDSHFFYTTCDSTLSFPKWDGSGS